MLESTTPLQIFVDGSYDPVSGRGGWGFVVLRGESEIAHGLGGQDNADNGTMEIAAILNACRWLAEHAPGETAVIWSDSVYAINGCNRWRHIWRNHGWKKRKANGAGRARAIPNAELWQEIDRLLSNNPPITIDWCKGHSGILGNERADNLAETGRLMKIPK